MNYEHFKRIIEQSSSITKEEIMAFTKLPQHQKEQLIKLACFKSELEIAKILEKKTFSNGLLMGKILSELLFESQPQNVQMLEWLFTFGQLPNIDKSIRNIFIHGNETVLDCIFSRCPLNPKKIYSVLHFAIEHKRDDIVDWILDRQQKKYIPFEHDMYYLAIFACYKYNNDKAKDFVEKLITYMPQEMNKIKEKMANCYYPIESISSNYMIANTSDFQVYFNNLETVALQFKLENTLKKNEEIVEKKRKV